MYRDYRREVELSKSGKRSVRSNSEVKPENIKLISASPFRAVIKSTDDDLIEYDDIG